MTLRALRTFGFALSVVAAVTASPPPARAVPLQIDLTINFQPPGPSEITDLTGTAQFWWLGLNASVIGPLDKQINIASAVVVARQAILSPSRSVRVTPASGKIRVSLVSSFGGTAGGFPAYAFMLGPNDQPPGPPDSPLALKFFEPPGPVNEPPGPPVIFGGQISANDAWVEVGDWQVTVEAATPLPGALAMFSGGLGVIGLLGWRPEAEGCGGRLIQNT